MLLNKEELYAIRLLISFKRNTIDKTIEQLSKDIGISKVHAYKLTRKLKRAGLIDSSSGRKGGYYLTRSLSKISVFDVHTALNSKNENYDNHQRYDEGYMSFKMKKRLKRMDRNIISLLKKIKLNEMG